MLTACIQTIEIFETGYCLMRKWLPIVILIFTASAASGCSKFRKEKSLSEWEIYRRGAQASIDSLRDLRSIEFEGENLPAYRAALAKTEQTVNQFLIESRETGRASRA